MREGWLRRELEYLVWLVGLFVLYVVTARIGLSLYAVNSFATLIWPPTGIALAALLLGGYRFWPALLLGAFTVNVGIGAPPYIAAGIALGNTLEAVVALYLLNRIDFFTSDSYLRLRDTLGFIVIAGFIATIVSATIGIFTLYAGGMLAQPELARTWFTWWIGDALGALVFTPFIAIWISATRARIPMKRRYEIMGFLVILVLFNTLAFWSRFSITGLVPLLYLIPIPLIWATLRFGARGKTAAIFITALMTITATVSGHGPFAAIGLGEGLLVAQTFVGGLSIIFLLFAAVVEERFSAEEQLGMRVEELRHALARISAEDQAKSDFLAVLAHELRNPLAPILSALELVKSNIRDLNDPSIPYWEIINTHTHTIAALLDDLLDMSRVSRRKLRLNKEQTDLRTRIANARATVESFIRERRHTLTISLPQEPLYLPADPLRLEQILVNLLNNAAKYTAPGGTIELTARRHGEQVVIAVRDNGIGIEPRMLSKIFNPYMQANRSENSFAGGRPGTGLGVGLYLTKRLVELHGGTIKVESWGVGKGSEFTVTLPSPSKDTVPLSFPAQSAQPAVASKRRKVLVVDDNKPAAQGIALLLQHHGHETLIAYDGKESLSMVEEYSPEVVILDIGLPDMNGYEVAQKIKSRKRDISLIALTGYGQSEDRQRSSQAGFAHHLIKPVAIAEVEKVLAALP